jgi:NitT/TauT family transport system permease protein
VTVILIKDEQLRSAAKDPEENAGRVDSAKRWVSSRQIGKRILRYTAGPLLVIGVWELARHLPFWNSALIATPSAAFGSLAHLVFTGSVFPDLWQTLLRMSAGLALATLFGVSVGLLIGSSRWLYESSSTVVDFFRSVPVTTLYPIFVWLLGIGHVSKIGMVFVACLWVIMLNSAYGVLHAKSTRREMAHLFGATRFQIFKYVTFWEAMPQTVVGLRMALSYALIVELLCEMFMGSQKGLGQRITEAYTTFRVDELWALVILVGALGFFLNRLFVALEERAVLWIGK